MAHRGWVGNGFAVDTWWKNAAFYELDLLKFKDSNGDGSGDFEGLTSRLEFLQSLGVDAIVLSPLRMQSGTHVGDGKTAWDAVYGSDEDFDRLEQEASRRHVRLLVELKLNASQSADQMAAAARFWLSRGVAGFRVSQDASWSAVSGDERAARVRMLRHLCAGYAGDRIVLGDGASEGSVRAESFPVHKGARSKAVSHSDKSVSAPQINFDRKLEEVTQWNAVTVRGVLQGEVDADRTGLIRSDGPDRPRTPGRLVAQENATVQEQVARQLAVVMLAGREWPLIYFGQEMGLASKPGEEGPPAMQWGEEQSISARAPRPALGPDAEVASVAREDEDPASLLNWYRKLGELRHSQAALRTGSLILLDSGNPDLVAWVRRGTGENAHAAPVLVVLNLSSRPVVVSMHESLHRVGLEASSGVRPLAVSPAGATPSFTASSIELQAYGAYVGELRQAGLEASSSSSRHGRHRGR